MTQWRKLIPGSFGTEDGEFALHPCDEQRAEAMLTAAKEDGATLDEITDAIMAEGLGRNWSDDHLQKQRTRLFEFLDEKWHG